jgi:hypothetical protein
MSPREVTDRIQSLSINVGAIVQAILLAAILGTFAYVWRAVERIPTAETMDALRAKGALVDVMRLDMATDRAELRGLREDIGEVKVSLAEIERLLRVRMGMPKGKE